MTILFCVWVSVSYVPHQRASVSWRLCGLERCSCFKFSANHTMWSVFDFPPSCFGVSLQTSETPSRNLITPRPCRTRSPWKRTRCGRSRPRTPERPRRGSESDRWTNLTLKKAFNGEVAKGGFLTLQGEKEVPEPRGCTDTEGFLLSLFLLLLLFFCRFPLMKRRNWQGGRMLCDMLVTLREGCCSSGRRESPLRACLERGSESCVWLRGSSRRNMRAYT